MKRWMDGAETKLEAAWQQAHFLALKDMTYPSTNIILKANLAWCSSH